jgi:hypothetical protein
VIGGSARISRHFVAQVCLYGLYITHIFLEVGMRGKRYIFRASTPHRMQVATMQDTPNAAESSRDRPLLEAHKGFKWGIV